MKNAGGGLDLPRVTQLGGHSYPRSFSNAVGPNVGLSIMQALLKRIQATAGIEIIAGTKVQI